MISEESGDESPEPQPLKKKKVLKIKPVASQRSIVRSTKNTPPTSPNIKTHAKDAESGNSSFTTEIPQVNFYFD